MKDVDKLNQMADNSVSLYRVKTVFPFDLFPGILTIDKTKIEYAESFFIGTSAETILVSDISSVSLTTGFFLATIVISCKVIPQKILTINNLPIKQAREAVNIIQGLMVTNESDVDVGAIPAEDIIDSVERLGTGSVQE